MNQYELIQLNEVHFAKEGPLRVFKLDANFLTGHP